MKNLNIIIIILILIFLFTFKKNNEKMTNTKYNEKQLAFMKVFGYRRKYWKKPSKKPKQTITAAPPINQEISILVDNDFKDKNTMFTDLYNTAYKYEYFDKKDKFRLKDTYNRLKSNREIPNHVLNYKQYTIGVGEIITKLIEIYNDDNKDSYKEIQNIIDNFYSKINSLQELKDFANNNLKSNKDINIVNKNIENLMKGKPIQDIAYSNNYSTEAHNILKKAQDVYDS